MESIKDISWTDILKSISEENDKNINNFFEDRVSFEDKKKFYLKYTNAPASTKFDLIMEDLENYFDSGQYEHTDKKDQYIDYEDRIRFKLKDTWSEYSAVLIKEGIDPDTLLENIYQSYLAVIESYDETECLAQNQLQQDFSEIFDSIAHTIDFKYALDFVWDEIKQDKFHTPIINNHFLSTVADSYACLSRDEDKLTSLAPKIEYLLTHDGSWRFASNFPLILETAIKLYKHENTPISRIIPFYEKWNKYPSIKKLELSDLISYYFDKNDLKRCEEILKTCIAQEKDADIWCSGLFYFYMETAQYEKEFNLLIEHNNLLEPTKTEIIELFVSLRDLMSIDDWKILMDSEQVSSVYREIINDIYFKDQMYSDLFNSLEKKPSYYKTKYRLVLYSKDKNRHKNIFVRFLKIAFRNAKTSDEYNAAVDNLVLFEQLYPNKTFINNLLANIKDIASYPLYLSALAVKGYYPSKSKL